MNVKINTSPAKATEQQVKLNAEEAVIRNRFSSTSIQCTGDVYISNVWYPGNDTAVGTDWIQLQPVSQGSNLYIINAPVYWLACSAEAYVCSYVSGNF